MFVLTPECRPINLRYGQQWQSGGKLELYNNAGGHTSIKIYIRHSVLSWHAQCKNECKAWHGTRGPVVGSSFHIPLPGLLDCSEVKETEKTSGASFILCDAFNVRVLRGGKRTIWLFVSWFIQQWLHWAWSNYFCVDHHARQISQRFKLDWGGKQRND